MGGHRMASGKTTETRMTLYRLTGMSTLIDALRDKYLDSASFTSQRLDIGGRSAHMILGKTEEKDVKWSSVLTSLSGESTNLKNSVAAAVLIITDPELDPQTDDGSEIAAWALTFGMGFQLIEQNYVDNGFGQRIAIRAAIPSGLNSISKTTLDERPRIERSTIASGGPLRSFGFEDLGDLATRLVTEGEITGIGRSGRRVKIKGADSLSLPLSKDPKLLLDDLDNIKATLKLEPASQELAALEQLALVKNADLLHALDSKLVTAIGENEHPLLAISFPHELIDEYGDAGAYKLRGTGERATRDYMPTLEALLDPLKKVPKSERKNKMDKMSVELFRESDDNAPISPKIKVKNWFAFQAEIDDQRYYLHNGKWFSVDRDYASVVRGRTQAIFDRGPLIVDLPVWQIVDIPDKEQQKAENAELRYNRILAAHLGGLCLDQKLVHSKLHNHGIEACDVLLKDGTFIHVKHVNKSAPASHLLAQALVSTEVLNYDKEIQEHLKVRIREVGGTPQDFITKPSKVVIVLAKDNVVLSANDLFTFTQVNLARQVAQLDQQRISVHIAPVARELLQNAK